MNANEEMLPGNADTDAMLLMLILMLLDLNTGNADTEADVCIKFMSLCCMLTKLIFFKIKQ